jgi:hypothetical protein
VLLPLRETPIDDPSKEGDCARITQSCVPPTERNIKIMPYLLVRHKVADYSKWKTAYDGHSPARQKAGLKEEHLLRNIDDPNEVILLFQAGEIKKAKEFSESADLREAMQNAGVVDKPDIYFLS